MTSLPALDAGLRDRILKNPDALLSDLDVMRALIAADEKAMGRNVVDLRGVAMARLEERLDRLEDMHRCVVAAAYENLAGTNQVHRAILTLLEAQKFEPFLGSLATEVAPILRVDALRLVLEAPDAADDPALARLGRILAVRTPGFIEGYLTAGRPAALRQVTLRAAGPGTEELYGRRPAIRSEALLLLDFGRGSAPGLLALGSVEPEHFTPQQGTDLLAFFAGVFERAMRRWLA